MEIKQEQQLDANLVISELNNQLAQANYQIAVLNAQINQIAKQQTEQKEED